MDLNRIVRALIFAALASVGLYAVLAVLADAPETLAAIRLFPPGMFFTMMVLAAFGYTLRALRWGWLMRRSGTPASTRDALYLHFTGQAMSVTPGRVGEVVKPWLSREVTGMPMPTGVALLFTERVADLIGVCVLSLVGLTVLGAGGVWLAVGLALVVAATALVAWPRFHGFVLGLVARVRLTSRFAGPLESAFSVMERSLSWRTLVAATPISVIAWGVEGVGFVLCVRSLGFIDVGPAALVSIYAASTIIGAFTFLPGGIGLTEASLAGILVATGMAAPAAAAVTIVVRAATLWWGVAIGWIAFATRPSLLARIRSGQPGA